MERGLTAATAAARLAEHGPNVIATRSRRGPLRIALAQFANFMVLVLAAAALLAGLIGEPQDSIAIAAILLLNAALGFVQEHRAERALHALRALAEPLARVQRDGAPLSIPAAQVVPDDLVLLEAGNLIPADLRLIEVSQLRVDESSLTGESVPVEKVVATLPEHELPLAERFDRAWKGTTVVSGRGAGIVIATGCHTELGKIAELLAEETGVQTPLQRRLQRLGQVLALSALVICGVILLLGLLRGEDPLTMVLTALSLAVAAIPEALPAVVTVVLALGARRMIRQHALVRRLPAVETLGSVTCICADKTGTLTENRMEVAELSVHDRHQGADAWFLLLDAIALNNDAGMSGGELAGEPMEIALYRAALANGCDPEEANRRQPRIGELPFTAGRRRMTTLHQVGAGVVTYTKGAPEELLALCVNRLSSDLVALDRSAVLEEAAAMAARGLRVLAVAYRRDVAVPAPLIPDQVERGLTFLGLLGIHDPPRAEAIEAVERCHAAGITVIMITGDHAGTARAIAERVGILQHEGQLLGGAELGRLDDAAPAQRVKDIRVYARVAPEQKLRIVAALQAAGHCVAMTGDGVNDAPALRRADIGIAMGKVGTDVAREAAELVLLDDNFRTIVSAVRAGRRIYDNIRKFVRYVVSSNAAEIWTLLLAPLIALPIPLLPIHLLWINLVTDGLPGLALAAEPAESDVMRRPPRPPGESFFARGLWQHTVWVGLLMAGVTLGTQAWAWRTGLAHWQTMTFTVLALSQMGHLLAIRSEWDSLFRIGPASNRPLLGAVLLTVALQASVIYLPAMNRIFRTQPLGLGELLACGALSLVVFAAVEVEKWGYRRRILAPSRS